MAQIKDLINDKTKSKLNNMKNNMSGDVVKGAVVNDGTSHAIKNSFIGATPNLNSSLGVNAVDGTTTTTTPPVTSSKLNTIYTQNQALVDNSLNRLLGLVGIGSQPTPTAPAGNIPPPPVTLKSGMAWYWWALIALVVLVIIFIVIKKMRG